MASRLGTRLPPLKKSECAPNNIFIVEIKNFIPGVRICNLKLIGIIYTNNSN